MSKIVKAQILEEMKKHNDLISELPDNALSIYIRAKYKCTTYFAREIIKELRK